MSQILFRRYRAFLAVSILLVGGLLLNAYRHRDLPYIANLKWERIGVECHVRAEVHNPREEKVSVRVVMRPIYFATASEHGFCNGIDRVVEGKVHPKGSVTFEEQLPITGSLYKPEVRVFLIADPAANQQAA